MEWIKSLTTDNLLTFLLIAAALLWIYNLIASAVKNHREMKAPKLNKDKSITDRLVEHERFLANNKRRLELHDGEIDDLREGTRKNCAGVKALLNHQLHDGNNEEMERAASDLDAWLINR